MFPIKDCILKCYKHKELLKYQIFKIFLRIGSDTYFQEKTYTCSCTENDVKQLLSMFQK